MDKDKITSLVEKLESKQRDCVAFSKKYESRKMEDLKQYYEGAKWAFDFTIAQIKELDEKSGS